MLSAEKLKYLRLLHNVTQQELGNMIGTSKNYISELENRKKTYSQQVHDKIVNAIYKISEQKKLKEEDVTEIVKDVGEEVKKRVTKKNNSKEEG